MHGRKWAAVTREALATCSRHTHDASGPRSRTQIWDSGGNGAVRTKVSRMRDALPMPTTQSRLQVVCHHPVGSHSTSPVCCSHSKVLRGRIRFEYSQGARTVSGSESDGDKRVRAASFLNRCTWRHSFGRWHEEPCPRTMRIVNCVIRSQAVCFAHCFRPKVAIQFSGWR